MKDPRSMTVADRKVEEQRQAQAIAEAVQEAIQSTSSVFDLPMLNAIAAAIVTVEAAILAAIPDTSARKSLRKAMEARRPGALADALTRSSAYRTETVVVRRHDA